MENSKENISELKFTKKKFYIILFLLIIGILMCLELGYIFYKTNFLAAFVPSFCSVSDLIDCDGVAQTTYSVSMGVPNALWGLILYGVMLMLLFVDRIQMKFKNTIFDVFENPSSYITSLGLLSFAISLVLAFISIFEIHKICALCFCTYFINLFIAIAAKGKGFFLQDIIITIKDFLKGAKQHFILFIVVLVAFVSTLVYLDKTLIFSPKLKRERTMKEFYEAKVNKFAIKGNVLGKENAKVKIVVYTDYNCPFCRILNMMIHKAAKEKNIIVEGVNYPLDTTCNKTIGQTLYGHETSCMYSKYVLAAEKQGEQWSFVNLFFDFHPQSEEEIIEKIRERHIKVDINKLKSDVNSPEIAEKLQKDIERAMKLRINGTPAMEINDVFYMGGMPYEDLIEKINLAKKRTEN